MVDVTADSGEVLDVQAAIDTVIAGGGGSVTIPDGTFTFDPTDSGLTDDYGNHVGVLFAVPAGGITIKGSNAANVILGMPEDDLEENSVCFQLNGESGGKFRFSKITPKGRPNFATSPTGDCLVRIESCTDFRVDHCNFHYAGATAVKVGDEEINYDIDGGSYAKCSQGLVDHCNFYDIYKPACTAAGRGYGYGVSVSRGYHYLWSYNIFPDDPWDHADGFGKYYKNTYIEDCYFHNCRHAAQATWAGAYVLRYSTVEDIGMYEVASTGHPVREDTFGQAYCEIYQTLYKRTDSPTAFIGPLIEGGYGLIYDCTFQNLDNYASLGSCEDTDGTPYHPLGHTGEVYLWSNTITDCGALEVHSNAPDGCGSPVEDADYFLDTPASEGHVYAAYTYPHPLNTEAAIIPLLSHNYRRRRQ